MTEAISIAAPSDPDDTLSSILASTPDSEEIIGEIDKNSLPDAVSSTTYQPDKLHDRTREMIRMRVMGLTYRDIGNVVGLSYQSVQNTLQFPSSREEITRLRAALDEEAVDITKAIQDSLPEAVDIIVGVFNKDSDAPLPLKMRAAESMLDRAGYGKIQKIQGKIAHGHIGVIGIEAIKKRAREIGVSSGNIIDLDDECPTPA